MKHTVRTIAELANVSPATVSRVLSGTGSVAPEKREKILNILKQLGPDAPGSRAASRTGGKIGLLLLPGSESDPRVLMNKLHVVASKLPRKWDLVLLSPEIQPRELESRHLHGDLAGVLLVGHDPGSVGAALEHIPHVWLNSYRTSGGEPSVLMGNDFAGRIAARYLIGKQICRPVCLDIPSCNPGFPARLEGFRFEYFNRMPEADCATVQLVLPQGEMLENCSDPALESALEQVLPELTGADGIFSPEDRLTAFLYRVFLKNGKTLPTVISCNRTPEYLAGLYPRPASIDLGAQTGAELGLEELFRRISGGVSRSDDVAVIAAPRLVNGE